MRSLQKSTWLLTKNSTVNGTVNGAAKGPVKGRVNGRTKSTRPHDACWFVVAVLSACALLVQSPAWAHKSLFTYTQSPQSRVFADLQVGTQLVSFSELDFTPLVTSVGAGVWVFDNIGIDFFYDTGISDDDSGNFSTEIDEATGFGLRFQTPPKRGFSGYVNVGYVDYQVSLTINDALGSRRVSEGFAGGRIAIGLSQRLRHFDFLSVTGEYRNYFSDDDLQADSVVFGLRVNFQ